MLKTQSMSSGNPLFLCRDCLLGLLSGRAKPERMGDKDMSSLREMQARHRVFSGKHNNGAIRVGLEFIDSIVASGMGPMNYG